MSTERILIHGTTAQRMGTTPAQGQIGSDDDTKQVILGDGATPGGIPMAKESQLPSASRLLPVPVAGDVGKVPVVNETEDGFELVDGGGSAANVTYDNAASGLAAATVQAALDELAGGAGSVEPHLFGLTIANNSADSSNDIDIGPGQASSLGLDMALVVASTLTKRLDAGWAAGSGNGGLDSGSKAANTWYHVWLIGNLSTGATDALFSTSATNPTMPSGWTAKRRIGSIVTGSLSTIAPFRNFGGFFHYMAPAEQAGLPIAVTTTAANLTMPFIPPGVKVIADIGMFGTAASATYLSMCDPDLGAAGIEDAIDYVASTFGLNPKILTNTAQQVSVRGQANLSIVSMYIRGWFDFRDNYL